MKYLRNLLLLLVVAITLCVSNYSFSYEVYADTANYTALENAVSSAKTYIDNARVYTDASIWKLRAMVDKVVYGRESGEQALVDKDVSDILSAIDGLKPVRTGVNGFDENNVALRMGAMSDVHLWVNEGDKKFETALKMLNEKVGENTLDMILFGGDITDKVHASKNTTEIREFKKVLESQIDVSETSVFYALGNHDASLSANVTLTEYVDKFSQVFNEGTNFENEYFTYDVDKEVIPYGNRHAVYNGYHFFAVQIETGYTTSTATLEWLDEELAKVTAENPNQYVFIVTHCAPENTVYGTETVYNNGLANNNIGTVLEKYPQVFCMSGHFHNDTNLATSIMQEDYTCLELGSVNYASNTIYFNGKISKPSNVFDPISFSQFSYIEVDTSGNVRIYRMDAHNNQVLDVLDLYAPDEDGYFLESFTKYRYYANGDLVFASDAKMKFLKTDARKGILEFSLSQGKDILFYDVYCTEKDSNSILFNQQWTDNMFYFGKNNLPETTSGTIRNVKFEQGKTYTFSAYPCDEWGRTGEPLVMDWTFNGSEDASSATVTLSQTEYDYEEGGVYTPSVTVTYNGKTFEEGVDYILSYLDNDEPGTARVTVTFVNDYSGSVTKTFEINRADLPTTGGDSSDNSSSSSTGENAPSNGNAGNSSASRGCGGYMGGSVLGLVITMATFSFVKDRKEN